MILCNQLDAWRDGELGDEEARAFIRHARECPSCEQEVMDWLLIKDAVQKIHEEDLKKCILSDDTTLQKIEEGFAANNRRSRILIRFFSAGLAAILILAIALFVWNKSFSKNIEVSELISDASMPIILFREGNKIKDNLISGDLITLTDKESAMVEVGAATIGIDRNTALRFYHDAGNETQIDLQEGRLAVNVAPRQNASSFVVRAGNYEIRVIGTVFLVKVDSEKTTVVSVSEGEVEIIEKNILVSRVAKGEGVSLSKTGKIEKHVLSQGEYKEMDELLDFKKHKKPVKIAVEVQQTQEIIDEPIEKARKVSVIKTRASSNDNNGVSIVDLHNKWESWIIEGRISQTREAINRHLQTAPRDSRSLLLLADCEKRSSNWSLAVINYKKVINLASGLERATARFQSGVLLQERLGEHKEAMEMFEKFFKENQSHPLVAESLLRQAKSLMHLGRDKEAKSLLDRIVVEYSGSGAAIKARQMILKNYD